MLIKCPWCTKTVKVHKGRLASHILHPGKKCAGVGQPASQVATMNKLREP